MTRTVKAAVLLLCLSLCALGLILSLKGDAREFSPETEFLPVENPQPSRGVGLRV